MNLTLDVRKGSRVLARCTGMTAIAAMMDSEAGGVDRAMLVDCLGAGGGPRETLVEKRQNISGEWMSVEKRTAAPTVPYYRSIESTHRTNPHAPRPVGFRESDAKRTIRKIMP